MKGEIFMTTTIQKWGNSQGIRLPKHLLETLHWTANEEIIIKAQDNRIIIEQAPKRKHKTIAELFEGYEGGYTPEEIDWGNPMGREVW